jgi:hypothetical protein
LGRVWVYAWASSIDLDFRLRLRRLLRPSATLGPIAIGGDLHNVRPHQVAQGRTAERDWPMRNLLVALRPAISKVHSLRREKEKWSAALEVKWIVEAGTRLGEPPADAPRVACDGRPVCIQSMSTPRSTRFSSPTIRSRHCARPRKRARGIPLSRCPSRSLCRKGVCVSGRPGCVVATSTETPP